MSNLKCSRCRKCGLTKTELDGEALFWGDYLLKFPESNAKPFLAAVAWVRVCRHALAGHKHPDCLNAKPAEGDELANLERKRAREDADISSATVADAMQKIKEMGYGNDAA